MQFKCTKCKNSFDSEKELNNHMSEKHTKHKSVNNDDSVPVKGNKTKQNSSKNDDHKVYSEESDSESDILEPYICPECGKECEDLEDFSDHFKHAHNL